MVAPRPAIPNGTFPQMRPSPRDVPGISYTPAMDAIDRASVRMGKPQVDEPLPPRNPRKKTDGTPADESGAGLPGNSLLDGIPLDATNESPLRGDNLLSALDDRFGQNAMLGFGLGLLSGRNNQEAFQLGLRGFMSGQQLDMQKKAARAAEGEKKTEKERLAALGERAMSMATTDAEKAMAMADPTAFITFKMKQDIEARQPAKPVTLSKGEQVFDPTTGKVLFGNMGGPEDDRTSGMKEYQFAKSQGYTGTFEEWKKTSTPSTTVNVGGGNEFDKANAKKQAEIFATVYDNGMQAQRAMGDVNRLEAILGNVQTGGGAAMRQALGQFGIPSEGLSEIQAAEAIINKLVPQQRPPGSGTMSDRDVELFKSSLPRIINQPGGNQMIIDTMRGIAQYDAERGRIAGEVMMGRMTREQGLQAIMSLPNPLDRLNNAPSTPRGNGNDPLGIRP